jgi:hypothetical protein
MTVCMLLVCATHHTVQHMVLRLRLIADAMRCLQSNAQQLVQMPWQLAMRTPAGQGRTLLALHSDGMAAAAQGADMQTTNANYYAACMQLHCCVTCFSSPMRSDSASRPLSFSRSRDSTSMAGSCRQRSSRSRLRRPSTGQLVQL